MVRYGARAVQGHTIVSVERADGTLVEADVQISGWSQPAKLSGRPEDYEPADGELEVDTVTLTIYDAEGEAWETREVSYEDLEPDVRRAVDEAIPYADLVDVEPDYD